MQATQQYLDRYAHIEDEKRQTYAAMVSAMDDGVGSLLNQLEALNISDNTLIFFLSDNGGNENLGANNGELKKGKGSLYEGGIRVPFAMQWPNRIAAKTTYDLPVISLDIFSTVAEITNMKTRDDLDGVNILPYLTGKANGAPHDYLFWKKYDQNRIAVRAGNAKLVSQTDTKMYFDLTMDIGEENPLEEIEETNRLLQLHQEWDAQNVDPVFLGLGQNKKYTKQHPERFENVDKY